MMRYLEPGWVELSLPNERRGIWIRITHNSIELCAGREGDDEYVKLEMGKVVSEANITDAEQVLSAFQYAKTLDDFSCE